MNYVRTWQALALELGVSPNTITSWKRDYSDYPKETARGHDVVEWQRWRKRKAEERLGSKDLREQKLQREIRLLDIDIDERLNKLKPVDEWISELREVAAVHRNGLDQWLQWVAAEFRNPAIYTKAKATVGRLCDWMVEQCAEHGKS